MVGIGNLILIGVGLVGLSVAGMIIGIFLLLTPLRGLSIRYWRGRIATILLAMLMLWLAVMPGWAKLQITTDMIFGCILYDFASDNPTTSYSPSGGIPCYGEDDPAKTRFENEVWLRSVVPAPMQPACFSEDTQICADADRYMALDGDIWWMNYLVGIPVAFGAGSILWYFTRREDEDEGVVVET